MSKKRMAFFACVSLAAFVLFTALCSFVPLAECRNLSSTNWLKPRYDFNLRLNEIACVRDGVNPFDVWHEDVIKHFLG